MTPMTSTTFAGGVNESLVAIDVCTQTGELYSGVQELLLTQSNLGSLSDAVTSVNLTTPSLLMTNIAGEVAIDPAAVLSSVSASASSAFSAIQSAPAGLKSALTAVNSATTQINTTIAGITSSIKQASTGNVTALFETTKGLIDPSINAQLKDVASLAVVGSNVVKQAATTGLGGAFTAIAQSPQFQGTALDQITKSVLPVIGAVGNIKAFVEVASQKGPALLSAAVAPNLGIDVLASFNATKNNVAKTQKAMTAQWGQFKTSATVIKGNFFTAQKNLQTVFSSKGLQKLSKDSKTMLTSTVNKSATQAANTMAMQSPAQIVAGIKQIPVPSMEQVLLPTLMPAPNLAISTPIGGLFG